MERTTYAVSRKARGYVENQRRLIAVRFPAATFSKIGKLAEKNNCSFSEQINRLVDTAMG